MRLFVCEFITGGGLQDQPLPDAWVREADLMQQTVLSDLLDMGISDIITTRDPRLEPLSTSIKLLPIKSDIYSVWQSCMHRVDATLIIAPETNDILFNLISMAERSTCDVIGSSASSVRTFGNKLQTAYLLGKHKIPSVETFLLQDNIIPSSHSGWVVKPNDGIFAENCYFYDDEETIHQLRHSMDIEGLIIQKRLHGQPASLSMLCHQGESRLLACNKQHFNVSNNKTTHTKITVNGLPEQWDACKTLAKQIAAVAPQLSGYIGVDLMIVPSGIIVLEVNPRLTTSYAGLRKSLSVNPADLMLSLYRDQQLPTLTVKPPFLPVDILLSG